LPAAARERTLDAMRQIFPSKRAKIGVIVFCALALMALLISCRREVEPARQSPQSPQPQQAQEPKQSPQPPQSSQPKERQEPHARVIADIRAVATLLEDYKSRNGAYPTTGQGLEALGAARKDPWEGDYIYQSPSTRGRESYDLFSTGPDGQPDTPDDDWGEE
jgi:hypothetical protein